MAKTKIPAVDSAAAPDGQNKVAEFEKSLDELESLVARMEHGELSLDESLQSFERGIALFRNCQSALEQAELRVKQLLDPADAEAHDASASAAFAESAADRSRAYDPDTP